MLHVECLGCRTSAYTDDNADPDSALVCVEDSGCCKDDHHHGENANAGTVCRPVKITVLPGSIVMQKAGA